MALTPQESDRLVKRLKPLRQDFAAAFRELVGEQLFDIDERLRADVDNMSAFRELAPLPDADRVVLRNRLVWLLADHQRIRGNIDVPATWTLVRTTDAMMGFDGRDALCPRPDSEIRLLNALAEHYAEQVVLTRLAPGATRWIEAITADMLSELKLPKGELPAVRNIVRGIAQSAMVRELTKIGDLDRNPKDIRRDPFQSFR